MAVFDYAGLQEDASALIDEFGRSVTLVKFDETPADAAKPWRGDLTPRLAPSDSVVVNGVFSDLSASKFGFNVDKLDFADRSDQVVLISPPTTVTQNLEEFDEIIDGTVRYKIEGVKILKPGSVRMLYIFGVSR